MFRRLLSRLRSRIEPAQERTVRYTRGDALLTETAYRSSFERDLARALSRETNISDEILRRAVGVSATAFACMEYRAMTLSSLPLHVVDPQGAPLTTTPLAHFLQTAPPLLFLMSLSLDVWGRSYLRKLFNPDGWPTGLKWLNPLDVMELWDGNHRVYGYRVRTTGAGFEDVPVEQIIYLQAFDPDPYGLGLSRFEVAWRALNIEQGLATYAAAFFINSARPDGILSFDRELQEWEWQKAEQEWRQNFRGASNAHKTAIMPGAKWTPIQTQPVDARMGEIKQEERLDICAVFRVHPVLIGLKEASDPLSANSTYGKIETGFIRGESIPRLKLVVFPDLNKQWAHPDFYPRQFYSLAVNEAKIPALAEANLVRSQTADLLTKGTLLDYPEARDLLGYDRREDYLKRSPAEAQSLFRDTLVTRNQALKLIGLPEDDLDYVLLGGQLVPAERLAEAANKNVERLGTSVSPFGLTAADASAPSPALPSATVPPPPAGQVERADPSLCVALHLGNDPDLIALQHRLRAYYRDAQMTWNAPDEFHVTLLYAPATPEPVRQRFIAALRALPVPDLDLRVGSLHSFDNVGEYALHFRIRRNPALLAFQEQVFRLAADHGLSTSAYSIPDAYIPHITMGYCADQPRAITFHSRLTVKPRGMICWQDDDVVFAPDNDAPSARSAAVPSVPAGLLEFALSFAGNSFVRYARRALSARLTAQGEFDVDWLDEEAWRLPLVAVRDWTPADAAALIRKLNFDDVARLDLSGRGYLADDGGLYLAVADTEPLRALRASLALESSGTALETPGILLGYSERDPIGLSDSGEDHYPLVGGTLVLRWDETALHQWSLRGVSAAARRELQNWERVARRKGAAYPFTPEALASTNVAAFVGDALAAGVELDDVFSIADSLLRGEMRAYPETREAFVSEIIVYITQGQASEIDRRNFAARMRAALRRFGLQAFRDGMNAEGYDPESFSTDELAVFRAWQDETSGYVTNFGAELFTSGITEAEIAARADAWASKSLRDIYYRGSALAAPEKPKRWQRDPAKDSCEDCRARDGQVRTFKEWQAIGLPGDSRLACHGMHCGCRLENVD